MSLEWTKENPMENIVNQEIRVLEHVVHAHLMDIQQLESQVMSQLGHIRRITIFPPTELW